VIDGGVEVITIVKLRVAFGVPPLLAVTVAL